MTISLDPTDRALAEQHLREELEPFIRQQRTIPNPLTMCYGCGVYDPARHLVLDLLERIDALEDLVDELRRGR